MIVENNYGYQDPTDVGERQADRARASRASTSTATARAATSSGRNTTERAPTVVPKLSLANGLIYTYTKDPGIVGSRGTGRRSTSAPDASSTSSSPATGVGYNNNYAGIQLSRKGVEYLGTLGGLIALRDS